MNQIKVRFTSWLMLLGLSMLPLYVASSGGVQIAHPIFLVAALGVFALSRAEHDLSTGILLALFVYVVLRDSVQIVQQVDWAAGLPILYLAYSVVVFEAMRRWSFDPSSFKYMKHGIIAAELIAVLGVIILGDGLGSGAEGSYRSVGTFNNPNQLGYFSVCLLSIGSLLRLKGHVSPAVLYMIVTGSLFLAVASLSKAAMVACGVAALFMGFVAARGQVRLFLGGLCAVAAVVASVWAVRVGIVSDLNFVDRLAGIGSQGDDSLAGRGYHVFAEMGAGEFIFGFGTHKVLVLLGHEMHSTIGSYFTNYGVLGGGLFIALILLWVRRIYGQFGVVGLMLVVVPPMLYGLTHNGSRFTIFWILLGVSMSAGGAGQSDRKLQSSLRRVGLPSSGVATGTGAA